MKTYKQRWYEANKERVLAQRKKYYTDNHSIILEKAKQYKEQNPTKLKEWREANAEHVKAYKKKYKQEHKEQRNKVQTERKQSEPLYKLTYGIRSMIATELKRRRYTKQSKTYEIIGCTFEELKLHLESQFEPWMNWNNYGNWNGTPTEINTAWDIDHIIPLDTAKTEDDVIRLNHYTNLQPLCSYTNRNIKRNTVTSSQIYP
jgi:hypothetical protein